MDDLQKVYYSPAWSNFDWMKLQVWGGDVKVYSDFWLLGVGSPNMFFNSQLYSQNHTLEAETKTHFQSCPYLIKQTPVGVTLLVQWSPIFMAPGTGFLEDSFSRDQEWGIRVGRWFWNDSNVLHLLYTLFLLLLHQLHLRSSGISPGGWRALRRGRMAARSHWQSFMVPLLLSLSPQLCFVQTLWVQCLTRKEPPNPI